MRSTDIVRSRRLRAAFQKDLLVALRVLAQREPGQATIVIGEIEQMLAELRAELAAGPIRTTSFATERRRILAPIPAE